MREEIDELEGDFAYKFAMGIGMSEHRFGRLRKGRVKTILDKDVTSIAAGLSRRRKKKRRAPVAPEEVRVELERRAQEHREEVAREV